MAEAKETDVRKVPSQLQALPWMQQSTQQILELWHQQKLPHALCLQASKGFGKQHQLRFLVNLLMCKQFHLDHQLKAACGQCQHCILLSNHEHPDFFSISTGGKSGQIGIDQIRQIHDFSMTTAYLAPMRLIVIDELERLTLASANALLKHLEEPPPNVFFLLSTAKPSQLMPTVRSRIQFFSIASPTFVDFKAWITTQIDKSISSEALQLSFELAQTGPFGALTWLLKHFNIDKSPPGLFLQLDSVNPDMLADYQRLLDFMGQTPRAAKTHLSVMVQALTLDQSSLLFELWLHREITLLGSDTGLIHNSEIEQRYQALLQIHEIRQELVSSPQLNITHLKRRLLKTWFSCNIGKS